MKLKIKKLYKDSIVPEYKTDGAVGMDLHARLGEDQAPISLYSGEVFVIGTGIAIQIPIGYEATVRSRSGLATRGVIVANSPGTLDCDFRGEVGVILTCISRDSVEVIRNGDRIAQLVISPVVHADTEVVDDLDETVRGSNGFGSTGV